MEEQKKAQEAAPAKKKKVNIVQIVIWAAVLRMPRSG